MKKAKQFSFFSDKQIPKRFFGGALLQSRRKSMRPLSKKDSIHFVLRSEWAMGVDSFLAKRNYQDIQQIIKRFAKKFGVRIYQQSINSNHIHLLLRITNRHLYKAFIKATSGQIASHVMGQQSFKLYARSRKKVSPGDGSGFSKTAVNTNREVTKKQRETLSKEGEPQEKPHQGFWQFRPFSRLVNWGKDFKMSTGYLKQNVLEAFGFIQYKPRKNYYSAWIKKTIPDLSTA